MPPATRTAIVVPIAMSRSILGVFDDTASYRVVFRVPLSFKKRLLVGRWPAGRLYCGMSALLTYGLALAVP